MSSLVSMFFQVVDATGVRLPGWAYPVGITVVVVLLLPFRLRGERANTARRLLLKASAAGSVAERDQLEARAIAEVRGDPHGLLTIASWAVDRGRYPLARQVLDLPALARHPERIRLRAAMAKATPLDADAILAKVLGEDAKQP